MNEIKRDQSTELLNESERKKSITFVDHNAGKSISFPILNNTYKSIVENDALDELDMGSIVKGVYEKVPRKSILITISVGDCLIEKSISATAYGALFNCTQNEIENLAVLPGMIEEIDEVVIKSIPHSIRPSTYKQRKFAEEIGRVLKIDLSEEIRDSKDKLGKFISEHIGYYELVRDEVYSNLYVCRILVNAMNKYASNDKGWRLDFNTAFNIYIQLTEYEQTVILNDLISEFGDKYWIECQECFLSQIIIDIFTKLLASTDKRIDYAGQFEGLVDLR
ncbi:MAG: hypothetical protein OQK09_16290 [Colwellia sp.]|nr:hypothetical protein [Colwellia sp.]